MNATLIGIGSELTSGQTINSNASSIARRLQDLGISCSRHLAIADDHALIVETLREALHRSELVITTGGLGPTVDDITVQAIADAIRRPLILAPLTARRIRAFYRQNRRPLQRLALRQAHVPEGAEALPNPAGTAPGLWLLVDGTLLVALPGVPREMRSILEHSVLPRLRRHTGSPIVGRTIRTVGVIELKIQGVLQRLPGIERVQFGLYPHLQSVDIRLTVIGQSAATATRLLDRLERAVRRRLGSAVYGIDEETLEAAVGKALVRRRWTLAVAESCTGGLIADRITDVPGSSRYLHLGVVAYHDQMKRDLLGVNAELLARHGAVSAPVAKAMSQGARRRADADVGLAVTGIAGPSGGTPTKPVGLVYLAVADRRRVAAKRYQFWGDRLAIKQQTAQIALDWLRRWALGLP